jgi:hypothetical protein
MSGGSDGYYVTDATSGIVVTSTTDTDNEVTPRGMAVKNRNLPTGQRYPCISPKQQLIHGYVLRLLRNVVMGLY